MAGPGRNSESDKLLVWVVDSYLATIISSFYGFAFLGGCFWPVFWGGFRQALGKFWGGFEGVWKAWGSFEGGAERKG